MTRRHSIRAAAARIVLVVLVAGVLYYAFVYMPIIAGLAANREETVRIENETRVAEQKAAEIERMHAEIAELEKQGNIGNAPLAAYDSQADILLFLGDVFGEYDDFAISLSPPQFDDALVRRAVNISFTATSFDDAALKLRRVCGYKYRCRVSSFSMDARDEKGLSDGNVAVSMSVVFYETQQAEN